MYNKTIGDLLYYYRNQKKISEEELCSGICSVSTYSRYESDETTTDKFTYGYFFERMGVDFDTINYLSSPSEGKIENERNKIYCCLKEKNYEGTKALLEEYVKKHGKKKIHKQYAMLVKGWLSELKGDKEKAQVSYAAGIACTNIDIHNINKLYSSIECELLLCYIRCTHNTDYLSKLLTFLQGKDEYDCIRAHFQTKASLQYIKGLENIDKKIKIINETEDYLKNIKRITGLNRLLKEKKALADMAKLDDDEQVILDNIDLLFQIRDIEPNNKATYTESDLIRNLRKETNLTQIQLSNDICDTTLLARYEEGKVDPGKGKYRQLMNKMGRDGQNYKLTYATGKFQDIKQYYKIEKMFENNENDRALQEMFYNDIESNFVTNDLEKSQMISRIKLLKEKYAKKLSVNQYIGKLEKLLSRSIQEYQKGEFSTNRIFNETELYLLNDIAMAYDENNNKQVRDLIYKNISNYAMMSHILFNDEAIKKMMINYSNYLGREGKYKESVNICILCVNNILQAQSQSLLYVPIYNIGWLIKESQKNGNDIGFDSNIDAQKCVYLSISIARFFNESKIAIDIYQKYYDENFK